MVRSIAAQRPCKPVILWGTCRLRCQTNSGDSPAASAIRALQQQRHYFCCMASTTASTRRMDDLRTSSLASVSRQPSLVTLVPRLSMTGRRGMYISVTSDVTPRKSQGVRPRGESRIPGRPGRHHQRVGGHTREKRRDRSAIHHNPAVALGAIRAAPQGVRGCRYTHKQAIS